MEKLVFFRLRTLTVLGWVWMVGGTKVTPRTAAWVMVLPSALETTQRYWLSFTALLALMDSLFLVALNTSFQVRPPSVDTCH